jgi:hypothetical protein
MKHKDPVLRIHTDARTQAQRVMARQIRPTSIQQVLGLAKAARDKQEGKPKESHRR